MFTHQRTIESTEARRNTLPPARTHANTHTARRYGVRDWAPPHRSLSETPRMVSYVRVAAVAANNEPQEQRAFTYARTICEST